MDLEKIRPCALKLYRTLLKTFTNDEGFRAELAVNYSAGLAGYAARQGAKEMAKNFPVAGPNTEMRDDYFLSLFFKDAGYSVMNNLNDFFKIKGENTEKPDAEEIIKRISENVNSSDFKLYTGDPPVVLNDTMKYIWDGLYDAISADLGSEAPEVQRCVAYNTMMVGMLAKAADTMPVDEIYRKALESAAAVVYLKDLDDDYCEYPEELRHLFKSAEETARFVRSILTDKKEALIIASALAGHACYMAAREMGEEFTEGIRYGDKKVYDNRMAQDLLTKNEYNVLAFATLFLNGNAEIGEDKIHSIVDDIVKAYFQHVADENYKICGEYDVAATYRLVEHIWDMYFEGACHGICKSPIEWPRLYSLLMMELMSDALEDMTAQEIFETAAEAALFFIKLDKDSV